MSSFHHLLGSLVLTLLLVLPALRASASSPPDSSSPVIAAAMKLVQFCDGSKEGFEEQAVSTLVEHVLSPKQDRQFALPKLMDSTGAYYEFDTRIAFSKFMEYSYSPLIPAVFTRPSSVRYSTWMVSHGGEQRLPETWKVIPAGGPPLIIHCMQRESDTPDLHTGVYHEYNL